jgi:hypothetical protein
MLKLGAGMSRHSLSSRCMTASVKAGFSARACQNGNRNGCCATAWTAATPARHACRQRNTYASGKKRSLLPNALRQFETEHVTIKRQPPFEVGHLQVHVANPDLGVNRAKGGVLRHAFL